MMLGDLIEILEDEVTAIETLVGLGDLALVRRVEDAAAGAGLTPGGFAVRAVELFSNRASDEDWVSLMGAMGRATDPGEACLKRMVEFALLSPARPQGCRHHA